MDVSPDEGYLRLLEEEGDRLGLTSLRERADLERELLLDPRAGVRFLDRDARVVDVGSGGGCPGISLALARPDLHMTLLESNSRKAGFLRRVVQELALPRVEVVCDRAETVARSPRREQYDYAVAKAVAALPVLLELTLPLVRVGGLLLAYKGPSLDRELESATRALSVLQAEVEHIHDYALDPKSYRLCLVRKLRPTPAEYPRRPGMPAKTPM